MAQFLYGSVILRNINLMLHFMTFSLEQNTVTWQMELSGILSSFILICFLLFNISVKTKLSCFTFLFEFWVYQMLFVCVCVCLYCLTTCVYPCVCVCMHICSVTQSCLSLQSGQPQRLLCSWTFQGKEYWQLPFLLRGIFLTQNCPPLHL